MMAQDSMNSLLVRGGCFQITQSNLEQLHILLAIQWLLCNLKSHSLGVCNQPAFISLWYLASCIRPQSIVLLNLEECCLEHPLLGVRLSGLSQKTQYYCLLKNTLCTVFDAGGGSLAGFKNMDLTCNKIMLRIHLSLCCPSFLLSSKLRLAYKVVSFRSPLWGKLGQGDNEFCGWVERLQSVLPSLNIPLYNLSLRCKIWSYRIFRRVPSLWVNSQNILNKHLNFFFLQAGKNLP